METYLEMKQMTELGNKDINPGLTVFLMFKRGRLTLLSKRPKF